MELTILLTVFLRLGGAGSIA